MSTLFDTETRHDHPETEFTLSTASLLGIFFGLVLVCGVFFGFGYSMGRRSTEAKSDSKITSTNATDTVANSILTPVTPKPSASQNLQSENVQSQNLQSQNSQSQDSSAKVSGTVPPVATATVPTAPAEQPRTAPVQAAHEAPPPPARASVVPVASAPPEVTAYKPSAAKTSPAKVGAVEAVAASRAPAYGALPPTSMTGISNPAQPSVVQIAAVSHQEDADVLVAALKKRGYNVGIRHEPQDQLMHIQVGPFASRADAVAMRQKLLADGYNAIVKP